MSACALIKHGGQTLGSISAQLADGFDFDDDEEELLQDIARDIGVALHVIGVEGIQAQLRESQKLESIGTLAGGVAHEINNPINGIMNYAQLIKDLNIVNPDVNAFADEILHESHRISKLVKNLLAFSRHDKQHASHSYIAEVINDTLSLVKTVLRHDGITLAVNVPDDLPPVRCRSQQIQQVIMNLITNARDALKDGTQVDEKRMITITSRLYRKNSHAFLRTAISDTGPGIPDDVRIRMFEPFYTTKSRSMGTGLGLSICHNIISEHGGTIETESVKGQGATFSFDLPLDDEWTSARSGNQKED
jgi:signal transduction histidine kinase